MAGTSQSRSNDSKNNGSKSQSRNEVDPARMSSEDSRGPTHEQIARRAYELYAQRGYVDGYAEEDWAQAERELKLGRY